MKDLSMELGRLAQGNMYNVKSTDTIDFIIHSEVPPGEKVTNAQFVCDNRPLKLEPHCICCVVGGNKLECAIDSGDPFTNLMQFKILLNIFISESMKGACFASADIQSFFLASPMAKPKYMKIIFSLFPPDTVTKYNLFTKVHLMDTFT